MNPSSDANREWKLPAGSLVKIGGIPYALASDTVVLGAMPPQHVVTHGKGFEQGSSRSSCAEEARHDRTEKETQHG